MNRVVDLFATTDKQHAESEKQHVFHMLQSAGLPTGKVKLKIN